MHPIERLRYIARDGYVPTDVIVEEVVAAFAHLAEEPAGLTSLRRVLVRQGWCGPLWWAAARMLTASDGYAECREILRDLAEDRTGEEFDALLGSGHIGRVGVIGWTEQAALSLVNSPDTEVTVFDVAGEGEPAASQLAAYGANVAEIVPSHRIAGSMGSLDLVLVDAALAGPAEFLAPTGAAAVLAEAAFSEVPRGLIAGIGRRLPGWLYESASAHAVAHPPRSTERVAASAIDRLICEVGSHRVPPILGSSGFPRAMDLIFPVEP